MSIKVSHQMIHWLWRLALAALFFYFGVLAVVDPEAQAAMWVRPLFQDIITIFMPLAVFMIIFGVLEVGVAIGLLLNRSLRIALYVSIALLVGIIINMWWSDIALRDIVILIGVIYFLSGEIISPTQNGNLEKT